MVKKCYYCRSELILYSILKLLGCTIEYYYCPGINCKNKQIVYLNGKIVDVIRYKSIKEKRKKLYESIRSKLPYANYNYRNKVLNKYKKLKTLV